MKINKIYNESCLKTLSKMPDNFVNLSITSPPYNMNLRIYNGRYHSRQIVKEFSTKYEGFADNYPIEDYFEFHKNVLNELIRVSNLVFYTIQIVTGSKRALFKIIGEFSDYLKDIIIWDKQRSQPAMLEKVLNKRVELILIFEKDYPISRQFRHQATFNRGKLDDIWSIARTKSKSFKNGATFPEELVRTILENFSKKGDIIYDPFLGTGTTAVVAKRLNRKYIGSELLKEYYELSNERLRLI